jgi:hypothetical protein
MKGMTDVEKLLGLLGLLFVYLKLTHVIDWSWWYVTLPFWGGVALVLAIVVLISFITAIRAIFEK